jgi:hypothetical protein
MKDGAKKRFVVSIDKSGSRRFGLEAFYLHTGPWTILGSFIDNAAECFEGCQIDHEYNSMVITSDLSGVSKTSGPGAGPDPTAATMIRDACSLLDVTIKRPLFD